MPEPTSSGASAAGFAAYKAIGGAAAMLGLGAALAGVVVMLMTPPRSRREWAVGLISTVVGSICGGALLIDYLDLQRWMYEPVGLAALLGLAFACGLPAWALVRVVFTTIERRQNSDLSEVLAEARRIVAGRDAQP